MPAASSQVSLILTHGSCLKFQIKPNGKASAQSRQVGFLPFSNHREELLPSPLPGQLRLGRCDRLLAPHARTEQSVSPEGGGMSGLEDQRCFGSGVGAHGARASGLTEDRQGVGAGSRRERPDRVFRLLWWHGPRGWAPGGLEGQGASPGFSFFSSFKTVF